MHSTNTNADHLLSHICSSPLFLHLFFLLCAISKKLIKLKDQFFNLKYDALNYLDVFKRNAYRLSLENYGLEFRYLSPM